MKRTSLAKRKTSVEVIDSRRKHLHEFCEAVCLGNRQAMQFCDLWTSYCHGIDDLLDTRTEGRPTMSAEHILRLHVNALLLYNHLFYIANRDTLMPVMISVTNTYADSVDFEKSQEPHLKAIADVIRCCGNEVLFLVALICGGYQHMRKLSPKIRERSWILQHDQPKEG